MKLWKTLLLVALAAGLFGYIHYLGQRTEEKEPQPGEVRFFKFAPEDVTSFVAKSEGERLVVSREDRKGEWRITSPKEYEADRHEVRRFLDNLSELESRSVIERPEGPLSDFGLDPAMGSVQIFIHGGPGPEVLVGGKNPYGDGIYMKLAGSDAVYLAHEWTGHRFDISVKGFRKRDLDEFDEKTARRIDISFPRSGEPGGVLERQTVDDKPGPWTMTPALDKPLNQEEAEKLLGFLSGLRATDFMGPQSPEALKADGLDKPLIDVKVTLEGGETRRIRIGDKKGDEGYYVILDHLPQIYLVSTYTYDAFPQKMEDLTRVRDEEESGGDAPAETDGAPTASEPD